MWSLTFLGGIKVAIHVTHLEHLCMTRFGSIGCPSFLILFMVCQIYHRRHVKDVLFSVWKLDSLVDLLSNVLHQIKGE